MSSHFQSYFSDFCMNVDWASNMTMWSISDQMPILLPQYTSENVEQLIKSSWYMADIHKCTLYGLPLNEDLVFELFTCSRGLWGSHLWLCVSVLSWCAYFCRYFLYLKNYIISVEVKKIWIKSECWLICAVLIVLYIWQPYWTLPLYFLMPWLCFCYLWKI